MTNKPKPIRMAITPADAVLESVKGAAQGQSSSYRRAFGAKELLRIRKPGGKVGHAEIRLGRFGSSCLRTNPRDRRAQSAVFLAGRR